ncbi:MAG: hypothetical protein R2932_55395 [Caldilineaceae bacterium]
MPTLAIRAAPRLVTWFGLTTMATATINCLKSVSPALSSPLTLANGWEITTTTAGIGSYDFGGLIAGTYTVTVAANTLPIGAVLTTANQPLTVTLASTQGLQPG